MTTAETPLPGSGVSITLDRPRTLRFDFNAFCALKRETGASPLSPDFWQDMDNPVKLRAALWAALLHEDPKLTVEQAGNLVQIAQVADIATALAGALSDAMPSAKPETAAA